MGYTRILSIYHNILCFTCDGPLPAIYKSISAGLLLLVLLLLLLLPVDDDGVDTVMHCSIGSYVKSKWLYAACIFYSCFYY
jgi:hypothetical protein